MPIYEYVCRECQHEFETLVTGERKPACPACGGARLEKQLSVFAASTKGDEVSARFDGGTSSVTPCGACGDPRGAGSCSMS